MFKKDGWPAFLTQKQIKALAAVGIGPNTFQQTNQPNNLLKVYSMSGRRNNKSKSDFKSFSMFEGEKNDKGFIYLQHDDEKLMDTALLESLWMMGAITLRSVKQSEGQVVAAGGRALHTGRALAGRFHRRLAANGTDYKLVETDTSASLPYAEMAALWNLGSEGDFDQTVIEFFNQAVALDMLRIGLNGQYVGFPTDPDAHPNGEDVNEGWHVLAKRFNEGSQVITDPVTLGEGGDFSHLDTLVNHLIKNLIPKSMQEDPRLVVMVGSELAAKERLRLFNGGDTPANVAAAQTALSSVAGRFAFVPPFMPGKRLAVTTLANLHIYTQERTRKVFAGFVDERDEYEYSYLRAEGYALQDGFMYAAVDEEALTLIG